MLSTISFLAVSILLLPLKQSISGNMGDSTSLFLEDLKYFNKTDAKDITWAHAVNSKEKLDKYLKTDILMFEADVLMRFNRNDTVPVMAHPPDNNSDLTLEEFLNTLKPTTKGIKLDFKSILAVKPSMELLDRILGVTKKPLWLNADILPGPGTNKKSSEPVDAVRFIAACTENYPNSTLSLGWTTAWSSDITSDGYTQAMVEEMERTCRNLTQVVTFPLRAVYFRRSWKAINWLLQSSNHYTLTIWSSVSDTVEVDDLVWLTKQVDKSRLYLDLPSNLDSAFKQALANKGTKNFGMGFVCLIIAILSVCMGYIP